MWYNFISFILTMKKFWTLSLLWLVLIVWSLAWCWNNQTDTEWDIIIEDASWNREAVINYNDTLVDLASKCITLENNIWDAYDSESSSVEDIQSSIKNTIDECASVWESIKELGDREGDSSLKDWVITIIEKEIAYYSKFSELLPYLQKEDLTEDEKWIYDTIFNEVETLDRELSEASQNLTLIQEDFSKKHGYKLEDEPEVIEE